MWCNGKLSLAYLTVDGASPFEHVDAAASAGFAAAGLRIKPPTHIAGTGVVGNSAAARRLQRACRDAGIDAMDAEVLSITTATSDDDLRAMVDCAATVGFQFVQTVVEDADAGRSADRIGRLSELADAAGLSVAVEFMVFRSLQTVDAALRLVERSGAANAGILIDALHLVRSGGSPEAVARIPPERIAMVQLCDAPLAGPDIDLLTEARAGRLYPGDGSLWLNELLDVLPDGIPMSLEVPAAGMAGRPYSDRAMRAMDRLREFLHAREACTTRTAVKLTGN